VVRVTLEVKRSHERIFVILTECPVCGYEFDEEERRHVHLSEHDPDDFGLTPLGETNDAAQEPLWEEDRELGLGPDPRGRSA
jgi:hypothetical protein